MSSSTVARRRPATRRWLGTLAAILLAGGAAGCGPAADGAAGTDDASATPVVTRTLPPCADVTETVPDAEFPTSVPLPPGSIVTGNETTAGGGRSIVLLAPMTIPELGAFLEATFPAAGLELGDGEAEPNELEQSFAGSAVAGQLTARYSPDCPGVVTVRIAVRET